MRTLLITSIILGCSMNAIADFEGTHNTSLTINITVLSSCTISTSPLNFGNYSLATLDATTNLTITCTNTTPYNVGLSAGNGAGATVAIRKMSNGANTLNYSLYSDTGRSQLWGNTVGVDTLSGTGTGAAVSIPVYGRVFSNQTAPVGSYNDTITATVYF